MQQSLGFTFSVVASNQFTHFYVSPDLQWKAGEPIMIDIASQSFALQTELHECGCVEGGDVSTS